MTDMKKPEKGGKPKKITTKGSPGGSRTPGERMRQGKTIEQWAAEINAEHNNGTKRSQ